MGSDQLRVDLVQVWEVGAGLQVGGGGGDLSWVGIGIGFRGGGLCLVLGKASWWCLDMFGNDG